MVSRSTRWFVCAVLVSGCNVELKIPEDTIISCTESTDCITGTLCLTTVGICVVPGAQCTQSDGDEIVASSNNIPCDLMGTGDGICVDTVCKEPFCGDGFLASSGFVDGGHRVWVT